jgi:hypothetical protein
MIKKLVLAPIAAAIALSGCAPTGSSSFRDMSAAYRDVLEDYANDNVLLNIIRSSKQMPVSFLDMPSVIGTGSVGVSAGVNSSIASRAPNAVTGFFSAAATSGTSSYAPSVGLSVNSSFNFTQSSLDNAQFMTSFLGDIRPDIVANLTNNQTRPRSILYALVIDYIELRSDKNVVLSTYINNPNLPGFADFQSALYTLIQAGLSTEIVMAKQKVSALMTAEELNRNLVAVVAAQAQPGTMVEEVKVGGMTKYQVVRSMPVTRMCLNKQAEIETLGQVFAESAFCNSQSTGVTAAKPLLPSTAADLRSRGVNKDTQLVIKLRSTRNVFDFLGTLVNMQNMDPPRQVKVMSSDAIAINNELLFKRDFSSAIPLLVVEKGRGSSLNALSSVKYQGETYTVPAESNSYSREVLNIVSQLLTLNKVPGSIPASPAVLIK